MVRRKARNSMMQKMSQPAENQPSSPENQESPAEHAKKETTEKSEEFKEPGSAGKTANEYQIENGDEDENQGVNVVDHAVNDGNQTQNEPKNHFEDAQMEIMKQSSNEKVDELNIESQPKNSAMNSHGKEENQASSHLINLAEDVQAEVVQNNVEEQGEELAVEKRAEQKRADKANEDKTTDDEKLMSQRMSESTAHDPRKSSANNNDDIDGNENSNVENNTKDGDKVSEVANKSSAKKHSTKLSARKSKSGNSKRSYPSMSEKEEKKLQIRKNIDIIVTSEKNLGLSPKVVEKYLRYIEEDIAMCQNEIDSLQREMRKKTDLDQFGLLTFTYKINEMALNKQLNELDTKIVAMHSSELNTKDNLSQLQRLITGKDRYKKTAVSDLGNIADEITKWLEELARMSTLRKQSTVKSKTSTKQSGN